MSHIFSNKEELNKLKNCIKGYCKMPMSGNGFPGSVLEDIFAYARGAEKLNTYDFIDVLDSKNKIGWQVKSSKDKTPLTWKRVKLDNASSFINNSIKSSIDCQVLGDLIIDTCNKNALESINKFNLDEVGYSRLILSDDGTLCYFEKILCTKNNPCIFNKEDFEWKWAKSKKGKNKEILSSFQGFNKKTGVKWFSWHGLGENQLHFNGEKEWYKESCINMSHFSKTNDKLPMEYLENL